MKGLRVTSCNHETFTGVQKGPSTLTMYVFSKKLHALGTRTRRFKDTIHSWVRSIPPNDTASQHGSSR